VVIGAEAFEQLVEPGEEVGAHAAIIAPMSMTPTTRAYWQIHFCVVLWGFTAILGKMISLPALPLVWWRLVIVVGALLLFPRYGVDCARCRGA
jgi:hypothetical protein